MLFQVMVIVYAVAAGFVSAGVLASFYQLVTDQPPAFLLDGDGILAGIAAMLICVFAGPFIIMRNAIRGRLIERRPFGWLAVSAGIAAGWSLCSGIVVIEFALAIGHSIA
ncbi:DUF6949 family protein [Prosthecomicrobium sp. N25]|uniref:DUF6949 family protein n=1 Tax=Prosthecomicrobium sp. N25 TaxID=3129254 RepID=UPI003077059F